MEANLRQIGNILVSDSDKLSTAAANFGDAQKWGWSTQTADSLADAMTRSAEREFYAAMLPTAYGEYLVDPVAVTGDTSRNQPHDVTCASSTPFHPDVHPLDDQSANGTPSAWTSRLYLVPPPGDPTRRKTVWYGISTRANIEDDGSLHDNPSSPRRRR